MKIKSKNQKTTPKFRLYPDAVCRQSPPRLHAARAQDAPTAHGFNECEASESDQNPCDPRLPVRREPGCHKKENSP